MRPELHELERLRDLEAPLLLRQAVVLEPEGDVARHVEVREQGVALEDRVDVPLVGRHLGDVDAVEHDVPARRTLEAGDHAQRRRLSAAGGPDHREELARRHLQVDAVHGDDVCELLRQPFEPDLSLHAYTSNAAATAASPPPAKRR